MAKVYKIHPSIGIARVGNSPTQFYVGPEIPGVPPIEIVDGGEQPLQKYKDANGLIKRQAARFRVFEYEEDTLSPVREITSDEAVIKWQVHLVNSKAAGPKFIGGGVRNPGIGREQLTIDPGVRSISGGLQQGVQFDGGKFKGVEVYLGELQTDASGRLLVLGGRGQSASLDGEPITNFADNDGWYDDVSDGLVTAKITFPGELTQEVDYPAWVIVGPPDFAPDIHGLVTLYDIIYQVAVTNGWLFPSAQPSFKSDIFPILNRAVSLRWVNGLDTWQNIPQDWEKLSDPQDSTAKELREKAFDLVTQPPLAALQLTEVQFSMLVQWKEGNFVDDWTEQSPPLTLTPENLDRAALECCVGGGFFPGIEARKLLTAPLIYSEPFRLSYQVLRPGSLSGGMALPWQADFWDCQFAWWPSQRPDNVRLALDGSQSSVRWDAGIFDHKGMVENFSKLGFVVPRKNSAEEIVFVEEERDPNFPRPDGSTEPKVENPKNEKLIEIENTLKRPVF